MRLTQRARDDLTDVAHGFILALLMILALPTPSVAHDAALWFNPLRWDNLDVDYKIDGSIPGADGSAFENRVHDGAARWNDLCCHGSLAFDDVGNGNQTWANGACSWSTDPTDMWVFHNNISPIGEMQRCEVLNQQQQITTIRSARLTFDTLVGTGKAWHTADTEPGANEYWVEEAALHELGHGTGTFRGGNPDLGSSGGHWPYPGVECSLNGNEADRTMCPGSLAGSTILIPLEPHDIDTFQDWY